MIYFVKRNFTYTQMQAVAYAYLGVFLICFVTCSVFLFACGNPGSVNGNISKRTDRNYILNNSAISSMVDTVLSYNVERKNEDPCTFWSIPSKEKILLLLDELDKVDARTWNGCFGDWSCGAEGELMKNKERYYYRIDAGGWIVLSDGVNQIYYVCGDMKSCWEQFPSECFCDIEWNIK